MAGGSFDKLDAVKKIETLNKAWLQRSVLLCDIRNTPFSTGKCESLN